MKTHNDPEAADIQVGTLTPLKKSWPMQLNKRHYTRIALFLSLVIITNINPIHEVVVMLTSANYFRYSSERDDCTFMEAMHGRDTAMMKRWFNAYKQTTGDTTMYRLFSKNPLAFWRHRDYLKNDKYNLPYKSWNEIRAMRGENYRDLSNWQEF